MPKNVKLLPPRLLIASSTEGLDYARALHGLLAPEIDAEVWDEELFEPGEFTLESLEAHSGEFDGALVVATADDRVISRGKSATAPRDNLLFEFGLFVALFGRRRALLLIEAAKAVKVPTDVAGLTCLRFTRTSPPEAGLEPTAVRLKKIAGRWQETPLDQDRRKRLDDLLKLVLSDVQDRSGIVSGLGIHVFLPSLRTKPPSLIRVARQRSSPKSAKVRSFALGEGIVGTCWRREETIFADLTQGRLANASKAEWSSLSADKRLGMDWELLKNSRERYTAVGAVPITDYDKQPGFLGSVAFNLSADSDGDPRALAQPPVMRLLDGCAEMMAIVLKH